MTPQRTDRFAVTASPLFFFFLNLNKLQFLKERKKEKYGICFSGFLAGSCLPTLAWFGGAPLMDSVVLAIMKATWRINQFFKVITRQKFVIQSGKLHSQPLRGVIKRECGLWVLHTWVQTLPSPCLAWASSLSVREPSCFWCETEERHVLHKRKQQFIGAEASGTHDGRESSAFQRQLYKTEFCSLRTWCFHNGPGEDKLTIFGPYDVSGPLTGISSCIPHKSHPRDFVNDRCHCGKPECVCRSTTSES